MAAAELAEVAADEKNIDKQSKLQQSKVYAEMMSLLELGMDCERYKSLPVDGGVLDQPAGLIRKVRRVTNVFHAFKEYETRGRKAGEMAKWKQDNPEFMAVISEINELRSEHGE